MQFPIKSIRPPTTNCPLWSFGGWSICYFFCRSETPGSVETGGYTVPSRTPAPDSYHPADYFAQWFIKRAGAGLLEVDSYFPSFWRRKIVLTSKSLGCVPV